MPEFQYTPEEGYSPEIQSACDKLVRDLHAAGLVGSALRRHLGLTPRTPTMRFQHLQAESSVSLAERKFVNEMRRLGVAERMAFSFSSDPSHHDYDWSDFPGAHDYLHRSFANLAKVLESMRIEEAKKRASDMRGHMAPQFRAAATLEDIMGLKQQKSKAPEDSRG